MTVFSGCLKIIKSKIGITIMYFVIFTGISIAMQLNNSKQSVTDFQSKRMDIAFVDCDKSEISGYIYDYLNTNHNVRKMKNDKVTYAGNTLLQSGRYGDKDSKRFW